MRIDRANDYWKEVYSGKQKYFNYINKLIFKQCNGFTGCIDLNPGITVICGLNGAGKSSIVSSIKTLLGLSDNSIVTKNKFNGEVSAEMLIDKQNITINSKSPAVKNNLKDELIRYIDSDQAMECLKYWEQSNIDEILDGISENPFSKIQLEEISQLIGKNYTECTSFESDEEEQYVPVFFKVKENNQMYTSIGMGIGEHFIFYMYYILSNIKENSIIVIEEPESYISILSQQYLMNYIAKIISDKRVSVIITSHSPYILKMVKNENIRTVYKLMNGDMCIRVPGSVNDIQSNLGMEYLEDTLRNDNKLATVFVEDYIARMFLDLLLKEEIPNLYKNVDIVSVSGESNITARLAFDDSKYMTYKFIGVYDGDMREQLNKENKDRIHWPYLFLPIETCVEKDIIKFLKDDANVRLLISYLHVDNDQFYGVLNKWSGANYHDWVPKVCNDIHKEQLEFIKNFYFIWREQNKESIEEFVNNFEQILKSTGNTKKACYI